ncbi:hypothetical protein HAX54_033509 [Datura stramonium]|uniref:Uncharacterized protein n=1 Tax=Datura stramonium TaxID=4076 RepID=A0ABS8RM85_DATST|nr:hypothetical protein [Datura stramonium]
MKSGRHNTGTKSRSVFRSGFEENKIRVSRRWREAYVLLQALMMGFADANGGFVEFENMEDSGFSAISVCVSVVWRNACALWEWILCGPFIRFG